MSSLEQLPAGPLTVAYVRPPCETNTYHVGLRPMCPTYVPLDRQCLDEMVIASSLGDDIMLPAGPRPADALFRDVSFRAYRRRRGLFDYLGRYECSARLRDAHRGFDRARLGPALKYLLDTSGTSSRRLVREREISVARIWRRTTCVRYAVTVPGALPVRFSLDFPPPAGVAAAELRLLAPYVRRTLAFLQAVTIRDVEFWESRGRGYWK